VPLASGNKKLKGFGCHVTGPSAKFERLIQILFTAFFSHIFHSAGDIIDALHAHKGKCARAAEFFTRTIQCGEWSDRILLARLYIK
jgi:hypothetical protein